MNKFRFTLTALAIMAFTLMVFSSAQAQATRTWVSGVGDDANPCSRTAPCKTFAGAISKTAITGEISVLDPGGFGAINITKSITINGEGTLAGILNSLVTGVIINAPTGNVTLRNISINAPANGTDGIRILTAKNVNIENVTVAGSVDGIEVLESSDVNVNIVNTQVKDCTGAALKVETTAGQAKVTIDRSSFAGSGQGILANRNARIIAKDSALVGNSVGALSQGIGGTAVIELENCMIAMNSSHGVQAGSAAATNPSIVRISDCHINGNGGAGASIQNQGTINTFMNNEIIGNTPDGCVGCTNSSASFN